MEWEKAYKSLLGCMIVAISNIDLLHTREQLNLAPTEEMERYYMLNVEAHCAMAIYENQEVQ